MKNGVAFIFDKGNELKDLAALGMYPKHILLGGYELEKQNAAIIRDYSENITESICVTHVPLNSLTNMPVLSRKILINLNSNQQIKKVGLKAPALNFLFNYFNNIICLSSIQVYPLVAFGVHETKIRVIPLGINDDVIRIAESRKKTGDYYITSGGDAGREFNFNIKDKKIKIEAFGNHNKLSYLNYCIKLVNSKGLILKINPTPESSDLSGSVTFLEGLVAKRPVFINPQPWLKDYPNPNVYVYKSDKELEKLLKKNIQWKKCDISYLLMPRYLKELKDVIYNTQ